MTYSLDEIAERIAPVANKHGISRVFVFGSYARGEANANSDIDILVDEKGVDAHGLFEWSGIWCDFEEALEKKVDMVTLHALWQSPDLPTDKVFAQEVWAERVQVYGKT